MRRLLLLLALAGTLVVPDSLAQAQGKRPEAKEDTRYEDSTGKRGLAGVEPGHYFEANETIVPGPARPAGLPGALVKNATLPATVDNPASLSVPAPGASHGTAATPVASALPENSHSSQPATVPAVPPASAPAPASGAVKAP